MCAHAWNHAHSCAHKYRKLHTNIYATIGNICCLQLIMSQKRTCVPGNIKLVWAGLCWIVGWAGIFSDIHRDMSIFAWTGIGLILKTNSGWLSSMGVVCTVVRSCELVDGSLLKRKCTYLDNFRHNQDDRRIDDHPMLIVKTQWHDCYNNVCRLPHCHNDTTNAYMYLHFLSQQRMRPTPPWTLIRTSPVFSNDSHMRAHCMITWLQNVVLWYSKVMAIAKCLKALHMACIVHLIDVHEGECQYQRSNESSDFKTRVGLKTHC